MAWYDFFLGKDAEAKPFDIFSEGQQGFQQQALSQAGQALPGGFQYLMKLLGGDEESLKEFSAPYMRQFQTQVLPSIFERFGGGGLTGRGDNALSSGLMNAATEAGAGLEGEIASQRNKMGIAGVGALQSLSQLGMTPQKGFQNIPGQAGALQGIVQALPYLALLL